jgi:predicted ester cyclase
MTLHNKGLARRFFEEICAEGRLELVEELVAADYLGNDPIATTSRIGREELQAALARYRRVVPAMAFHIEDQLAEDDRVATRWRFSGRIAVSSLPTLTTDAELAFGGISVMRFLAGRQVESWSQIEASAVVSRLRRLCRE